MELVRKESWALPLIQIEQKQEPELNHLGQRYYVISICYRIIIRFLHFCRLEQIYKQVITESDNYRSRLGQILEEWEDESSSCAGHVDKSTELEIAEETLTGLQDTIDQWRWQLDTLYPNPLSTVSNWVSQAERWMKKTSQQWYQKTVGKKTDGETETAGSSDPPNSPPCMGIIEKLVAEEAVGGSPLSCL